MKKEKIHECEVKKLHQINGQRFWKWIRRSVSEINRGEVIRCHACKGKVRLHKKRDLNGPQDHVEHIRYEDSKNCPEGFYFLGVWKKSLMPVE